MPRKRIKHGNNNSSNKLIGKRIVAVSLSLLGIVMLSLSIYIIYESFIEMFKLYVIVTGSMEPSIPRGSIVLVESINTSLGESPAIGDIVAYRNPNIPNLVFAHRLIDIMENGSYILKGDAVNTSEVVNPRYIIGIVVAGIPGGIYLALSIPYIAFILLVLTVLEGESNG